MTRFVVDASAVLEIARKGRTVRSEHELFAPTLLRSQTLSGLHEAVQRGEMTPEEGRDLLPRVGPPGLKIRLLGDAVLRQTAWDVASHFGWTTTYDAEYIALTQLQADAFVTLDHRLARSANGLVTVATIDDVAR